METQTKNPRRVEAGRRSILFRRGITPEGRERLRQAALRNKPWRFSTGPRTEQGKAKVRLNGKKRQVGPFSVREVRADLGIVREVIRDLREARSLVQ